MRLARLQTVLYPGHKGACLVGYLSHVYEWPEPVWLFHDGDHRRPCEICFHPRPHAHLSPSGFTVVGSRTGSEILVSRAEWVLPLRRSGRGWLDRQTN